MSSPPPSEIVASLCVCKCPCAGCIAIRTTWGSCECGLCKAFRGIADDNQPHVCIVVCTCTACNLLKQVQNKCDCLTCQLFLYGSI